MKKILTALCLLIMTIGNGQENQITNSNIDKWDKYTNPNFDNYFYHHFKKHITSNNFSKKDFPKNNKKIIIEFNLTTDFTIDNVRTNTTNSILKKKLINTFNKLEFEKFSIKKYSPLHNYSIQIIENENGKAVLKCSSSILHEVPALSEGCEKRKDFESYNLCFKSKLENYLFKNIDSAKIAHLDFNNDKILIKAHLNSNGKVNITNTAKNEVLKNEITSVLGNFNFNITAPATFNGTQESYSFELLTSDRRLIKNWLYKTSSHNNLALYFKENILEHTINQEFLNDKKSSVSIYFSLDKNGKPEKVTSSAKNKELDKYLVNAFKRYPIEKLNTPNRIHNLSRYHFKVIVSEDFKNRIECNNYIFSKTLPIVKGCSKSKSFESLKKCNQESISNFVNRNFNAEIASKLNLTPGVKRIFVMFKISKTGEITDVKARAPHKGLSEEAIRVVKKIKVLLPAYQLGKSVGIKYSLPIAFRVTENKPKTGYPVFKKYGVRN
tara:strand:- start:40175 stop:41662 length:1488 start_codon:yes stop_codon:yes gene_type:complete